MTPYESVEQSRKRENERSAKVHDFVMKQGIFTVQLSPRRHVVVRVGHSWGVAQRFENGRGTGRFYAHGDGELLFGPAGWRECDDFIQKMTEDIPDELRPVCSSVPAAKPPLAEEAQ